MNDDWRLRIDLREEGIAHALTERLAASELEHRLETSFADRVIVSSDGPELFLYTGSREQAQAAADLVRDLAAQRGWEVTFELARWHPEAESWEDPERPLPATEAEHEAEHAALIRRERAESAALGYPDWEVRVECRDDRQCAEFARRLESEGTPVVRRGRYLLVGAADEDAAQALAQRFHREAPEGSSVLAEGTIPGVYAGSPLNPFAVFGGLGG